MEESRESKIHSELQTFDTSELVSILKGEADIKYLIAKELKNRYLDPNGIWVGPRGLKEAWKKYVITVVDGVKHLIRK